MLTNEEHILIGNSYPLALVRRKVTIEPMPIAELKQLLQNHPYVSYWGHSNTLVASSKLLGVDLTPQVARPALELSLDGYPVYEGQVYRQCYVLSPDYRLGYRPAIEHEVAEEDILGWQALVINWQ